MTRDRGGKIVDLPRAKTGSDSGVSRHFASEGASTGGSPGEKRGQTPESDPVFRVPRNAPCDPGPDERWGARIELVFRQIEGRTVLARRRHRGPLYVQKPFHPGDGTCHVYLLHPPGGVAGGDTLDVDITVGDGAAVLVTTPAATKVYRSTAPQSLIAQCHRVGAGASLEWLPHDTILFGGSRLALRTSVELDPGARYCGWEIVSLGRPKSGDAYESGAFAQSLDIRVGARPLLIERQVWQHGDAILGASWGLAAQSVSGAFHAYPAGNAQLQRARTLIGWTRLQRMAATLVDDLLVVRALASDALQVQAALRAIWTGLRTAIVGAKACPPRIWST